MKKRIFLLAAFVLVFVVAEAQNVAHARGMKFDDDSYGKVPRKAALLTRDYEVLPASWSLKRYCPIPNDQGQFGTCTSWSTAYAARTIAEAVKNGWVDRNRITSEAFSPIFVYKQIEFTKTPNCEEGTCIDDALDLLMDKGVPKFRDFNVKCADYIPADLFPKALSYTIEDYCTLFGSFDGYSKKILSVKKSLTQNCPVLIGMKVPDSFDYAKDVWVKKENDNDGGGHAMCVVGYDDNKYGGAMLIMNSWGTSWGNGGFTWVKYRDFADNVKYAYEMILNVKTEPKPMPAPVPVPQPVVVKNKFSGKLRFHLSTGQDMKPVLTTVGTDKVYRMQGSYISGTRYRLYLSNNTPAYVYVLSSDLQNNTSVLFPPDASVSAALVYSSNDIALPDEKWFIEMDKTLGTDMVCVLYSKEKIDIDAFVAKIKGMGGTFCQRVRTALASKAVSPADVRYDSSNIIFNAESSNVVVPLFVEIKHN